MSESKKLKTGINKSREYQHDCFYLTVARKEAMRHLNETGYHHIADQFKDLARSDDPTHSRTVDVRAIEDFFELREKGGLIGRKMNFRAYFMVHDGSIIVLGCDKKEDDGQTAMNIKVTMRRRKRKYLGGGYGRP